MFYHCATAAVQVKNSLAKDFFAILSQGTNDFIQNLNLRTTMLPQLAKFFCQSLLRYQWQDLNPRSLVYELDCFTLVPMPAAKSCYIFILQFSLKVPMTSFKPLNVGLRVECYTTVLPQLAKSCYRDFCHSVFRYQWQDFTPKILSIMS